MNTSSNQSARGSYTVVSKDGTKIASRTIGSGQPIVLVHGSLTTCDGWREVAESLSDSFEVTAYDRRGRGGSGDTDPYSFEAEVDDLLAVLAATGPETVLVGHSFGGALAAMAARTSEIAALVLYEPGIRLDDQPIGGPAVVDMLAAVESGDTDAVIEIGSRRVVGLSEDEIKAARHSPQWQQQAGLAATWPRELASLDTLDVRPAVFADITVPTLLLRGTESPEWLRETTARTAKMIPETELDELAGQGHGATETAPQLLADKVRQFVDRTRKAKRSTEPITDIKLQADKSWNGTEYRSYPPGPVELTVVRYSIPPHSSLPWHTHIAPNTAFVMSGSLTLLNIDGVTHTFHAGDAFAESVGDEHRGYTEDEGAEVVCTYAGAADVPLSIPTGRALD